MGDSPFFRRGQRQNPFKISSERQLIEAFEREEKHFVLAKDITLTSSWTPKEFEGSLDGNAIPYTPGQNERRLSVQADGKRKQHKL